MGVSGSGKSTIGGLLSAATGRPFLDGDDLHSAAAKAKMAAGVPLDDADRTPWLRAIGARLAEGDGVIVACSALKRAYRDILREAAPGTFFAHLSGSHELLEDRLDARKGHFMPESLLDSQLATLEPLGPDENGAVFDISQPSDVVTRQIEAAVITAPGAQQAPGDPEGQGAPQR